MRRAAILCVEDAKQMARRRVPKAFYDYVDTGSWTESTYRSNEEEFNKIKFRQRVLIDVSTRSTKARVLGEECAMPVALSPCGFGGMMWPNGETHAARACEKFGIPFALSTMSINSIEDVAAGTTKPFWFQLYVMRDKGFVKNLISRAKAAKCSALILTADLQVLGQRHKDIRNGLTLPLRLELQSVLDVVSKPAWCIRQLSSKRWNFGNIVGHYPGADSVLSLSHFTSSQFDTALSWKDVEWIKSQWGGKLIIKGIMDPQDAKLAYLHGADAIVVSLNPVISCAITFL